MTLSHCLFVTTFCSYIHTKFLNFIIVWSVYTLCSHNRVGSSNENETRMQNSLKTTAMRLTMKSEKEPMVIIHLLLIFLMIGYLQKTCHNVGIMKTALKIYNEFFLDLLAMVVVFTSVILYSFYYYYCYSIIIMFNECTIHTVKHVHLIIVINFV